MEKYNEYPYVCPVCGKYHYETIDFAEICPYCGWEDDSYQVRHPDETGYNKISLNEAQAISKGALHTMNVNLTEEQLAFLMAETNRSRSYFENLTPYEAHDLRDFCFDIEVEEVAAHDICPRGEMAADIVDALYKYEEIPPDEIVSFTKEQAELINNELDYNFSANNKTDLEPWRIKDIYTRCKEIADLEQQTSRGKIASTVVTLLSDKRISFEPFKMRDTGEEI